MADDRNLIARISNRLFERLVKLKTLGPFTLKMDSGEGGDNIGGIGAAAELLPPAGGAMEQPGNLLCQLPFAARPLISAVNHS